jgi:hypothetical protein
MAKNFIYRNLHKDCFSLRYKGIVTRHFNTAYLGSVDFKVNQKGRLNVLRDKQKNVHAFVTCETSSIEFFDNTIFDNAYLAKYYIEVTYNPYLGDSFVTKVGNWKIRKASNVVLFDNKIYISKDNLKLV